MNLAPPKRQRSALSVEFLEFGIMLHIVAGGILLMINRNGIDQIASQKKIKSKNLINRPEGATLKP